MAFTDKIDISTPAETESTKLGDDRMREAKRAWQEFLNVNHDAELTGTEIDSATSGYHTNVHLKEQTDPVAVSDVGIVYAKDVSGVTELFYKDSDANVIQLTNDGIINLTSASLLGILANDTYLSAVDNAGTGTIDMIKVGTNDIPTLLDGAEMASSAAPTEDEGVANKKYVDDSTPIADFDRNYSTSHLASAYTLTFSSVPAGQWLVSTQARAICDDSNVNGNTIDVNGGTVSQIADQEISNGWAWPVLGGYTILTLGSPTDIVVALGSDWTSSSANFSSGELTASILQVQTA